MNLSDFSTADNSSDSITEQSNNSAIEIEKETSTSNNKEIIKKIKTSLFKQERDRLNKVVKIIRQANELDEFMQNTVKVIQKELRADRVIIYDFENETDGRIRSEALVSGWTPTLNSTVPCSCFGRQTAKDFQSQGLVSIDNVKNSQLTPHQKQLLEQFQVQASLAVPIMLDRLQSAEDSYALDRVWGLLVVQQCRQAYQWQENEINLLYQLSLELTRVLQPPLPRLQAGKQQDVFTVMEQEMQQSMQKMLHELYQLMKADRVLIYGFNPDGTGTVLEEQVNPPWGKAGSSFDSDCFLTAENCQSQYVVNDLYAKGFPLCLVAAFEAIEAKAYIAIPIKAGGKLIGMLTTFQNSSTRNWQEYEIQLMHKYAARFSLPMQQTSFMRQSQWLQSQYLKQSKQENMLATVMRESQQSMQTMLHHIRQLMEADRVLVYGFNPDGSGEVLAESVDSQWKKASSSLDKDYTLGNDCKPHYVVNDVSNKGFAQCFKEALSALEAQAYITVPIRYNEELIGILSVYQNSNPRNWQKSEVELMTQYASKFISSLQQTAYIRHNNFKLQKSYKSLAQEKALTKMLERIRLAKDKELIFQIATHEGRKLMDVDRLAVYRFEPDWSGKFIAESVAAGWTKLIDTVLVVQDTYLQETEGGRYKHGECFTVDDIYLAGHQECHLALLEQFEARAYIIAPVFAADKKLWGLIAAYQNTGARKWQAEETEAVRQIGLQVGIAMEQVEYIEKLTTKAQQEQTINRISERIRQSFDIDDIFQTTTQELRQALNTDRSVVYQFNSDWSGQVVAESVGSNWVSLLVEQTNDSVLTGNRTGSDRCLLRKWSAGDIVEPDSFLRDTQGGRYVRGQKFTAVDNIYTQDFPACYVQSLEKYQAKAYLIAPIFHGEKLWGLLGIYQNDGPRSWQESETEMMTQIANQLAVALQQAQLVTQLKNKAQREQTINRIGERIRQSFDIDNIFQTTTQELRQALNTDRSVVYQFNPDWSGQVVAESVGSSWVSLLVEQTNDSVLTGNRTGSDRCLLRKWSAGDIVEPDSFLRDTQGGRYVRGQKFTAVDNIYTQDFPACYVQSLEKYQAKAYLIAPIFHGEKLWGLLGIYQNDGPRSWQESETEMMTQIANQLAVALQQAKLVENIQTRNQELALSSERENSIIEFSSQLVSRLAGLSQANFKAENMMEFATKELGRVLQTNRVAIYRFDSDWSGEFIIESINGRWSKLVGIESTKVNNVSLQDMKGGRYAQGESSAVNNIYESENQEFKLTLLEQLEAKAYAVAPIFVENQLWGLLGVYQNDAPRIWKSSELKIVEQVGAQIGVILQLGQYLTQMRSQEQQLTIAAEQEKTKREQLQQGALKVLRALEPSFRGDLTVRAPLSEDEIGTIADGYNTTIQSLRRLVQQVQVSASRVSDTSNSNSVSVNKLTTQSQQQVNQLQQAVEELEVMLVLSQEVTTNAQRVEQAVQQANQKVQSGDSLMEKTVDSILEMKDTVSETAKKIKRLGEASQKISKVVNLIDNFATQTNLLSLNAAIEATRAGEYGKGFAVVADEVRVLAYQSANATTEIERLVEEIQKEVSEVTEVMEISIAQVVQGSDLVDETRHSLSEIVAVTSEISELVAGITHSTNTQSQQSQALTQAMTQVSTLANETLESSAMISLSFQELQETSHELQTSVSQFKVE